MKHLTGWSGLFLIAIGLLLTFFTLALVHVPPNEISNGSPDNVAKTLYFSPEERRKRAESFLFLRGYPKSGTSWTRMLVDLHQEIAMLPYELQLNQLDGPVQGLLQRPWQGAHEPYKGIIQEWHAQLPFLILEQAMREARAGTLFVGEKSPKAVAPLVEGARYLYVVRDGRDVIVSLLAHRVRLGGFTGFCEEDVMFGTDEALEAEARRDWSFFVQNPMHLLSNEKCIKHLAQHWAQRVGDDMLQLGEYRKRMGEAFVHIVQYETLVHDAEKGRHDIYRWLGLDPQNAGVLGLYTMPLKDLAPDSEFRPDNAFFRKGTPGDWENYFTPRAKSWWKETAVAERMLEQLYMVEPTW